ncbi:MAG: AMP-binding protein [Verrucomicrobiota bacterium]|nr:AMP-binding protein [Verrucomicrobiota bacterium]
MPSFLWTLLARFLLLLLSLRYRIHVKGLDLLDKLPRDKGVFFLPNHPAHMDPLFLYLLLWPRYRMRPVVVEYVYHLLRPLMRLVRAVPMPNFDISVNPLKVKRAEMALQTVAEGLRKGENFLFYPAGKLKNSAREVVGGASGAYSLLQECPDAQIVLIRTTGLWGSSFSRALLGRSPPLPATLLQGVKILLKNALFFAPRRDVEIEIALEPSDFPRKEQKLLLNRYLENWFNRYRTKEGKQVDKEPLTLVSYSRFKEELPTPFEPKKKRGLGGAIVSEELRTKIYGEIRRIVNNPGIHIAPEMHLATDLGMDSLNLAELGAFLLQSSDVEELHPEDLDTVQSVLEIAAGTFSSEAHPMRTQSKMHWEEEVGRPLPSAPEGKTLMEAFLRVAERMGGRAACGDDLLGVLSYKDLKRSALVLSLHFRKMPEVYVGVLLPATAVTYIVILALLFAGKVPVMLNWTLGPRYLDDMLRTAKVERVLSSWRFLDRLSHVDLGSCVDRLELLEEIRSGLSLVTKLKGAFLSLLPVSSLLRLLHLDQMTGEERAVVLFTSGTEASPKGVPLSHRNILSNQSSGMQCIDLNEKDVLYGILPPFHSFGFSVVGLFPLCGGIRVAFYPDPTDAVALAEGIERWKVTLYSATPSFVKALFAVAKKEQLKTIRYVICGAEKAPVDLIERVEGIGAKLIEGYGITECAPILTLTRPKLPHIGVGQALPDIEMRMVHPETLEPLPEGVDGEIVVRGPNVFQGYLSLKNASPFLSLDGKEWYRTGDIGRLDADKNLILSGRLKRFTKVGGEMISLGALEEVLIAGFSRRGKLFGDLPALALIADEREVGKPKLVLFSIFVLEKEEANEILRDSGFSRLAKIASVQQIEEVPLLGTGKTDYRTLQSLLQ